MMKKLLLFAIVLLLPILAMAQNKKIALLQTLNGDKSIQVKGIEMNMVRGELRKAISNQVGYQAFTRTDIDQLMKEHGFQNSGMVSDVQRKKLGEMSGADYICVSTLTKSESQFYLEAYLIDVETGEISNPASQFGVLQGNTYTNLFQLCVDLAKELITDVGGSSSSKKTMLRPVEQGYVDLGLPSGTLWKATNESGLYDYSTSKSKFGENLPSLEQWLELMDYCTWSRDGTRIKFVGINGKSIIFHSLGTRFCTGGVDGMNQWGCYWSSTSASSEEAYYFLFEQVRDPQITNGRHCKGNSIRLVKKP